MRSEESRIWALEEFGGLEAPDCRLKARLTRMAKTASQYGGGRISEVFRDPAERQGAYDLLEGGRVPGEALVAAMASACVARSEKERFVFVPLDGSSVSVVDRRRRTDLGVVGAYGRTGRGLQVVTALAVSAGGTTLGVCAQTWWSRPTVRQERGPSKYRPVHERESRFYVDTIRDVLRRYDPSPCKPWIVIDRGGDATVMLDELVRGDGLFTVRSSWNRRVLDGGRMRRLHQSLGKQRIVLQYTLDVPAAYNRRARTAQLAVRAARVELDVRHDWCAKRANPVVNVVWVRELRPPHGEQPLDWMLFTNAPIATAEDLRLVVRSYTMRWRIEDFHKTWKSGHCRVEDTKLRSVAAVKTWATLLAAVATRVERLKHLARNEPTAPATIELSALEIEALKFMKLQRKKKTEVIGPGIPSIELAVRWIADLGGYTGKSSGGPPGATTIGRGLDDLAIATALFRGLKAAGKMR
jgi:hypothetical protein